MSRTFENAFRPRVAVNCESFDYLFFALVGLEMGCASSTFVHIDG